MERYKLLSIGVITFFTIYFLFQGSSHTPLEYVKWVSDSKNGLKKIESRGPVTIDLQYKPIPFVIANEFRKTKIEERAYTERFLELEGAQYYTLKLKVDPTIAPDITKYNVSSIPEHQQRLYYLAYQLQNDIKLVDGNDTLSTQLFHFERSYDITPHRTFVLAFNDKNKNKKADKTFILDSKPLGIETLEIKFTEEELNNLPTLKVQ